MDENWLVTSNGNKFSCWNCHTQKMTESSLVAANTNNFVLLNNYNRDSFPTIFDSVNWRIIRSEEIVDLKRDNFVPFNFYPAIPVDDKVIISAGGMQYFLLNTETGDNEYTFPQNGTRYGYNPFNGCFLGQSIQDYNLMLIDPRSHTVETIEFFNTRYSSFKFTTENTFFYRDISSGCGFMDLRMAKKPVSVIRNLSIRVSRNQFSTAPHNINILHLE